MSRLSLLCLLLIVGCAPPATPPDVVRGRGGQWEALPPVATGPRQEHAVVALGGELVVVAGFDDTTTVASVEAYAPTTGAWRALPVLPLPLHHPNAAVARGANGDDVLVVAGFLVGANFQEDARVLVLDGTDWRAGAPMPAEEARGASAACAIDADVYVFGGLNRGSTTSSSRYNVDDDRWESLPDLPAALDHVLCVAHDDALWIVSGRSNGLRNHQGTLWRFDPIARTYEERAPMPTSRAGAAAAVVDDALYVVGGEGNADDASGVFASTERYRFADDRWDILVDMRTPRHGMGAAGVDGALYVPGGADVQGFGAVDVFERFVPGDD